MSADTPMWSGRRTADSSRPHADGVIPFLRAFNPLRRELSLSRAQLAALAAERALLLAKIELLEHGIRRLQKFAYHDELTGLPNRRLLEDRYDLAVARSERQRDDVALLFIDIDRFKQVNDAFGHDLADRVLQQLATRLLNCIRASDTACRYGGDEFVVLLSDCHGKSGAAATMTKIQERLGAPYLLDAVTLEVSASIGMALYPADGRELCSLIRVADRAMYGGKAETSRASIIAGDRAREDDTFANQGASLDANP